MHPQPRTVLCFNGEPIPRGVVILDVRCLMSTYTRCCSAVLIATMLAPSVFAQPPSGHALSWNDLAKWQGADVSNADFVRFVRDHQLSMRNDDDCGTLADPGQSFWMNIRKKQVVRVSVRIRPVGPRQHAFNGKLVAGISRDDTAEAIIKKMGSPAYDVIRSGAGGRFLVYDRDHLVFDFNENGKLFEIRLGALDVSAAPKKAVNPSGGSGGF